MQPKRPDKISANPASYYLKRSAALATVVLAVLVITALPLGRMAWDGHQSEAQLLSEMFNRWDAPSYLKIALEGYRNTPQDAPLMAFFPLYPLFIRLANIVVPNLLAAGILVSFICTIVAGALLAGLAGLDSDEREARRAMLYLFVFPTAYFLFTPYTEALFLALSLASFYCARKGDWATAGATGALAAATRLHGILLLPALVLEGFLQKGLDKKKLAWLILIPLGLLAYLTINQAVFGNPTAFMEIQKQAWSKQAVAPWDTATELIKGVFLNPPSGNRTTAAELPLAGLVLAIALLVWGARKLRPSYQIYAWGNLAIILGTGFPVSLPRYLLVIFPLFLVLAKEGRRPLVHEIILIASAIALGLFFSLYARGWWAF